VPELSFSDAMTANQTGLSLLEQRTNFPAWQFRFVPWFAAVMVLIRSTTTGNRLTIYTGSQTIKQRSFVQGGGVAGTTPSMLNTNPITFVASPGDYLQLIVDEVSAGTPTVDWQCIIEPIPSG
jgi:hypothetical protein